MSACLAQHTGYVPRAGPVNGTVAWSVQLYDTANSLFYAPIIGANGTVFYNMQAVNSTSVLWFSLYQCSLNGWALDASGVLYGVCGTGTVFAAPAATGIPMWTLQLVNTLKPGTITTAVTLGPSLLYVGDDAGNVYAVSTTGKLVWSYLMNGTVGESLTPALSADGAIVYTANDAGYVFGLAADTGALLWQFAAGCPMFLHSPPVVSPFGAVILTCYNGNLYAIDGTKGTKLWRLQTNNIFSGAPVVSPAGMLYVASDTDGAVYAVDAHTGSVAWAAKIGPSYPGFSSLALTPKTLYVSTNFALFGLDAGTGVCVMNSTAGAGMNGPAIGAEGLLIAVGAGPFSWVAQAFQ